MDDERFNRSLIDAVSIKAFLFNPYHPDRKNKLKQENAWKKIAASLNSTGKIKHIAIFHEFISPNFTEYVSFNFTNFD